MNLRLGSPADGRPVAMLHESQIDSGFLAALGTNFLTRLYRRVARHRLSFLLVVEDGGHVVGFAAASEDVASLYRAFLLRDGAVAAIVSGPRLVRSWRRVLETVRYPRSSGAALPKAELLSVAVAPGSRGRGYGRALVGEAAAELRRRGAAGIRVVVGAENQAAIALYQACGFEPAARFEMHAGRVSEVLTCR